jgi:hypothetical protein
MLLTSSLKWQRVAICGWRHEPSLPARAALFLPRLLRLAFTSRFLVFG